MTFLEDTLTIRGKAIPVKVGMMAQKDLRFFPDNPRIYSIVRDQDAEPEQDEIERQLLRMDHVKALVQDIKANGGLIDPVIVKAGTNEVLEGNSRLAAYRALAQKDAVKWGMIKCQILPESIDEADVFALLGQYHIKGKKDWLPYEQAGFLYRRHKHHKIPKKILGEELGVGQRKASQLIETYQFMIDHKEDNVSRWSYYEEYIKSKKIKKLRDENIGFDDLIVKKIKTSEIAKAVDVRDKLPKLAAANKKVVKRFVGEEIGLDEAAELVEQSGGTDSTYQRLHRFRKWVVQQEVEETILGSEGGAGDKIRFEINKLATNLTRLSKALSK